MDVGTRSPLGRSFLRPYMHHQLPLGMVCCSCWAVRFPTVRAQLLQHHFAINTPPFFFNTVAGTQPECTATVHSSGVQQVALGHTRSTANTTYGHVWPSTLANVHVGHSPALKAQELRLVAERTWRCLHLQPCDTFVARPATSCNLSSIR